MRLENSFTVGLPPAQAWAVLTDPRRVAPCPPGVHLREVDGDDVRGGLRVKVGPIPAERSGLAQFRSRAEGAGVVVVVASGREARGRGSVSATVALRLAPAPGGTRVDLATDLALTGRRAQFGRGVLGEVTGRLAAEFARAPAEEVSGSRSRPAAVRAGSPAAEAVVGTGSAVTVVDLAAQDWPDDEPAGGSPAVLSGAADSNPVGAAAHREVAASRADAQSNGDGDTAVRRRDAESAEVNRHRHTTVRPRDAAAPATRAAAAVLLRAIAVPVAKRVVPVVAAVVAVIVLARRLRR
ncbi:SRPBCC family protein [Amycolatopsis sp. NPDC004368]